MASGRNHALDSVLCGGVGAAVILHNGHAPASAMVFAFGAYTGLLLSPDLDQDGLTLSEVLLPWPFRWLFIAYWMPYAWMMPHRSFWSHAPVLSTFVRLAYFCPIWSWGAVVVGSALGWWVVGLMLSDTLHWLRDSYTSPSRRKKSA